MPHPQDTELELFICASVMCYLSILTPHVSTPNSSSHMSCHVFNKNLYLFHDLKYELVKVFAGKENSLT